MNSDDLPRSRLDGQPELLSAYLDGDLPGEQAAALEARLQADPGLARQLDTLAEALVALRQLDAAAPPEGFAARLADRLAEEARATAQDAPTAGTTPVTEPEPSPTLPQPGDELARRRARSTRATRAWAAWSGVAAALAAVAVVFAGELGPGRFGEEETADMALDAGEAGAQADGDAGGDAATLQAPAADSGPGIGGEEGSREQIEAYAEDTTATREAAVLPLLVDAGLAVADQAALQAAYAELPEAAAVLGTSRAEAEALVEPLLVTIRDAGTFPRSGLSPAMCLDAVTSGREGPLVPVRAEALEFDGEPALAYVVVLAGTGAPALDRVEAWVLSPAGCTTLAQVPLPLSP